MQFEKEHLEALKVLSNINPNIVIETSNEIHSRSASRNVYCIAKVSTKFDGKAPIYDLNEFLGVVSIVDTPVVEFNEDSIKVSGGGQGIVYHYAEESILDYPQKKFNESAAMKADKTYNFVLSEKNMKSIKRAGSILSHQTIRITGNKLETLDIDNPSSNKFTVDLEVDIDGEYLLDLETLQMPDNRGYSVTIADHGDKVITSWISEKIKDSPTFKFFIGATHG